MLQRDTGLMSIDTTALPPQYVQERCTLILPRLPDNKERHIFWSSQLIYVLCSKLCLMPLVHRGRQLGKGEMFKGKSTYQVRKATAGRPPIPGFQKAVDRLQAGRSEQQKNPNVAFGKHIHKSKKRGVSTASAGGQSSRRVSSTVTALSHCRSALLY